MGSYNTWPFVLASLTVLNVVEVHPHGSRCQLRFPLKAESQIYASCIVYPPAHRGRVGCSPLSAAVNMLLQRRVSNPRVLASPSFTRTSRWGIAGSLAHPVESFQEPPRCFHGGCTTSRSRRWASSGLIPPHSSSQMSVRFCLFFIRTILTGEVVARPSQQARAAGPSSATL